jgi:hypothetical protein
MPRMVSLVNRVAGDKLKNEKICVLQNVLMSRELSGSWCAHVVIGMFAHS